MMRLSKLVLPSSVTVGGRAYSVRTGHPYWFRFAEILADRGARFGDFDFLYDGDIPHDRKAGFEKLLEFYNPKTELPRKDGPELSGEIALDYTADSRLIFAAILEQYGVDLFEREIHWHKVLAMIAGLHSTRLNEIIGYRLYRKPSKNDSEERERARLKKMWRIESAEEKEEAEKAREAEKNFFSKVRK